MTIVSEKKSKFASMALAKYCLVAAIATVISGCDSAESDVQQVVIDNLLAKDVYKFGEFTEVNDLGACQTVNTMGTNGQETGDLQALLLKVDDTWKFISFDRVSHEECVSAMEDVTKEMLEKQNG
ncbi:hypothetical protein [Pseudomonas sp.]|uniref:hypothetical protein n=1 Tax=Pseudomonas sp. TaxID=306 RepID=UPI003C77C0B6